MAKKKYYVVWKGRHPGVYDSWDACKAEIEGVKNAQYKSFSSREEAVLAFNSNYAEYKGKGKGKPELSAADLLRIGDPNYHSISVDAASSGNPGRMEYRGVDTKSGKTLFKQGPFEEGTNNIGEFLAIVHALAYLKQRNSDRIIYSDSRTAMSWVAKKACNTKLARTSANSKVFDLVDRAVDWLRENTYNNPVVKWETRAWGEIPADFGRK